MIFQRFSEVLEVKEDSHFSLFSHLYVASCEWVAVGVIFRTGSVGTSNGVT